MSAPASNAELARRAKLLGSVAPFDRLREDELGLLAEVVEVQKYEPGAVMHHGAGSRPRVVVVVAGSVVTASGSIGAIAGLVSVFDSEAAEPIRAHPQFGAETLSIPRQTFFTVARECPKLIRGLLELGMAEIAQASWTGAEPGAACEVVYLDASRAQGVRALGHSSAGDVIGVFHGEVVDEVAQHTLQVGPNQHLLGTKVVGYLSHACQPNSRLRMASRTWIALTEIHPGDVVTIDYTETEDRLFRQFACACGADTCRRWIHGRREAANREGLAHLAAHGDVP
jgi:uncharacterized protein